MSVVFALVEAGSAALRHPWPPRHLHILCFIVPPSAVRTTYLSNKKGHPARVAYKSSLPGSAALGHPWPPRHLHILCFIVPPSAVRTTYLPNKKGYPARVAFFIWWSQAGSNRRPQHCQCCALPAELWPRIIEKARILVGLDPASQARFTQLRHIPSLNAWRPF